MTPVVVAERAKKLLTWSMRVKAAGKKKPKLSIGLNWVREIEFLEGPKETTGEGMPFWHTPMSRLAGAWR